MLKRILTIAAGIIGPVIIVGMQAFSQGTFDQVYSILSTNCAVNGCHGGTTSNPFFLGANQFTAYNAIYNMTPVNPAAKASGYKRVDPGHPYNSYLLKKIGHGFDNSLDLDQPAEGNRMPDGLPPLADNQIELIRQWIIQGAPMTGTVVDTAIINEYYSTGGFPLLTPPAPPSDTDGFQLRFGPLFVDHQGSGNPNEIEWLKKDHMGLLENVEVTRMEGYMNIQSHHFLLFKFNSVAGANAEDDGLRIVDLLNTATDGDKELMAAWQYDGSFDLPAGTAFFWDSTDWVDMNYHVRNISTDSILPVDFYLNVFTDPQGSGKSEMKAQVVNNSSLVLFSGTNTETMYDTWTGPDRKIWTISSHTHKYGTDFDVYVRNPNNSKGAQIYEGFYNEDYTFNQGYYDWVHPAIRRIDTLLTIKQSEGLIAETEWYVTQGAPVTFGLTTADEMQLITYLYIDAPLVGIEDENNPEFTWSVFPNPASDEFSVEFSVTRPMEVSVSFTDLLGRKFPLSSAKVFGEGQHRIALDTRNLAGGMGFIGLKAGETKSVRPLVIVR